MLLDGSAVLALRLNEPERASLIAATRVAMLLAPATLPWKIGDALVVMHRKRRLTDLEVPQDVV